MDDFRAWVRAELAARLSPRRADVHTSVLGAGSDDLEAGRVTLDLQAEERVAAGRDERGLARELQHAGIRDDVRPPVHSFHVAR